MKKPKIDKGIWAGELPFSLSCYTCEQLATLLQTTPGAREPAKLKKLRSMIGDAHHLRLLRLCGDAPATQWKAKMRTAQQLVRMIDNPIKLMIGGGKPNKHHHSDAIAVNSKEVKAMAAKHGIAIQRWGKGAYILAKP